MTVYAVKLPHFGHTVQNGLYKTVKIYTGMLKYKQGIVGTKPEKDFTYALFDTHKNATYAYNFLKDIWPVELTGEMEVTETEIRRIK